MEFGFCFSQARVLKKNLLSTEGQFEVGQKKEDPRGKGNLRVQNQLPFLIWSALSEILFWSKVSAIFIYSEPQELFFWSLQLPKP